jgi:phage-related baseplate assembly protein
MSRNTQYQFISTDADVLLSSLIAGYEKITQRSVQPASPDMLFLSWVADVIIQERVQTNYVGNQNLPSRAEGDNLDALGDYYYLKERPQPSAATCTIRFCLSEAQETVVLIPAGTRVTDTSRTLYWETGEDVYVPAGETQVDVKVTCQTLGTVGNGYAAGQINAVVVVYDYYITCENITTSANGSDELDDDEFYEMLRESQDAYAVAGPIGAYSYLAKSVSTEIADVVPNSPEPGVVCIYALMENGSVATEETKLAILQACDDEDSRPLTDKVIVGDPEEVEYNIDFTYYISRSSTLSATAIAESVSAAVEEYIRWQCGRLGRDINPDHLRGLLLNAGVKRIELKEPVFTDLLDGQPHGQRNDLPPQIAKVNSVHISNGGFEDE